MLVLSHTHLSLLPSVLPSVILYITVSPPIAYKSPVMDVQTRLHVNTDVDKISST